MARASMDIELPRPRRFASAECALTVIALVALVAAAKLADAFLVPVVVGMLASYSLKPLVAWLERVGVHRALGGAIVLAILTGLLVGGVFLLRDDATAAIAELPHAARRLRIAAHESARRPEGPVAHVRAAAVELNRAAAEAAGNGASLPAPTAPAPTALQKWIAEQSSRLLAIVSDLGIAAMLAYFLLASGDTFRRKLAQIAGPTLARRRITIEILDEIDAQVQRYLLTMLALNVLVAVTTWAILAAFGVDHAALWGVIAGVLHVVPYAGSALTIVATALAAFLQFETAGRALLVALAIGASTTLIGTGLSSWMLGRAFRMNAVAVFVALLFFGWLWGGWGLLVGVPLLATVKTAADRIVPLRPLGALISR